MQTEASDENFIKLQGAIVASLLKIIPEWEKYVVYEGKKKVPSIYNRSLKALYGTVDSLVIGDLFNMFLSTIDIIPLAVSPAMFWKALQVDSSLT